MVNISRKESPMLNRRLGEIYFINFKSLLNKVFFLYHKVNNHVIRQKYGILHYKKVKLNTKITIVCLVELNISPIMNFFLKYLIYDIKCYIPNSGTIA